MPNCRHDPPGLPDVSRLGETRPRGPESSWVRLNPSGAGGSKLGSPPRALARNWDQPRGSPRLHLADRDDVVRPGDLLGGFSIRLLRIFQNEIQQRFQMPPLRTQAGWRFLSVISRRIAHLLGVRCGENQASLQWSLFTSKIPPTQEHVKKGGEEHPPDPAPQSGHFTPDTCTSGPSALSSALPHPGPTRTTAASLSLSRPHPRAPQSCLARGLRLRHPHLQGPGPTHPPASPAQPSQPLRSSGSQTPGAPATPRRHENTLLGRTLEFLIQQVRGQGRESAQPSRRRCCCYSWSRELHLRTTVLEGFPHTLPACVSQQRRPRDGAQGPRTPPLCQATVVTHQLPGGCWAAWAVSLLVTASVCRPGHSAWQWRSVRIF